MFAAAYGYMIFNTDVILYNIDEIMLDAVISDNIRFFLARVLRKNKIDESGSDFKRKTYGSVIRADRVVRLRFPFIVFGIA